MKRTTKHKVPWVKNFEMAVCKHSPNPFRIAVTPETATVGPSPERVRRMFTANKRQVMTMERFMCRSPIPASAETVFDWHCRPGAFERLSPPWESVRVLEQTGGIRPRCGQVFLVADGPRIGDDELQAALRADILVEGDLVGNVVGSARLLVEEDALDARIELQPSVHVCLDFV